jgi:hypothetical protein
MTYKQVTDPDFIQNILTKREYVSLKLSRDNLDKEYLTAVSDEDDLNSILANIMVKTSNQMFIGNLMNPNTKIKRILVKWSTGIGKTIGSLVVATSMIKNFEKTQIATGSSIDNMPNIFVIGHTRERVIEDLLKFPDFGFVSFNEINRQKELNKEALSGSPAAISAAKDHYIMLKRRVTNKARGGYFRFFGYQELVNRMFGISKDDSSTSDLISKLYDPDPEKMRVNIAGAVNKKLISINLHLLNEFSNSLMIVDEFHNDYNIVGMNSWGATQAYIADNAANLRVIFMSATPATSVVTEYIDVMNLINEASEFPRLERSPNVDIIAEIKKRLIGRVSFLQDSDLRTYPQRLFLGDEISVNGKVLPYLKFVKCPISDLQLKAFEEFNKLKDKTQEVELTETIEGVVTDKDDYYIRDIAFPNPNAGEYPLYRAKESKTKISNAPESWKLENKLDFVEGRFTGDYLKASIIGKYSSKYKRLIDDVLKFPGLEKIVLFHNFVKISGVLMIADLLRMNGYIDYNTAESNSTICAICNKPKIEHNSIFDNDKHKGLLTVEKNHKFIASRFGIVHGEQPHYVNQHIFKLYNNVDNIQGVYMRVLIGAQMIKESIDLKAVRYFAILSMPKNIPTLLQIIGRGVRKGSHDGLPAEDKNCKILIYISTNPNNEPSLEEISYSKKLDDYVSIQKAEQVVHSIAVDAAINRDIIMSPDVLFQYGTDLNNPKNILGTLYYKPIYDDISNNPSEITYYAYNYQKNEITLISLLIRRLFYQNPIWTFDGLLEAIKNPPFRTEISPKYITEDNVAVSLNDLITQMNKKENSNWAIIQHGKHYFKMPKINNLPGSLIVSAPDAYVFGSGLSPPIKYELGKVLNRNVIILNEINELRETLKNNLSKYEMLELFSNIDVKVLDEIGKILIINYNDKRDDKLLKLFTFFNLLLKDSEVKKMMDIKLHTAKHNYIGYLSSSGPTVYLDGKWKTLSVSSAEIKKVNSAVERGPIIGYMEESVEGKVMFKIRRILKDIQKDIDNNKITDGRLIERGSICTTKNKEDLTEYLKTLMRQNSVNVDIKNISTKSICIQIQQMLMLSDAFLTGGSYRTFYWFHERIPNINL